MTGDDDTTNNARHLSKLLRLVARDGRRVGPGHIDDGRRPPIDPPGDHPVDPVHLRVGSDVEIARRLADELREELGELVWAEGRLWHYDSTHWQPYPEERLRLRAHNYDGALYVRPGRKNADLVQLGCSRLNSIINEFATILADPGFFEGAAIGVNCASGFLVFDETGRVSVLSHHPQHRARHVLTARWDPKYDSAGFTPPPDSMVGRLLNGSFADDDEATLKQDVLGEAAGSAVLGHGTKLAQPKCVVLLGRDADNGKSQFLNALSGLLPATAIASVPAHELRNQHAVVHLRGALANISAELSSARAIAGDAFKMAVTGDVMTGRDVYHPQIFFRPTAQFIYATNRLPQFKGGIDRGVERRLLVVVFGRKIPLNEQVERLGERIAAEEPDLLLAFAVSGARRLLASGHFTVPPSSRARLLQWLYESDAVRAWVQAEVEVCAAEPDRHSVTTKQAYQAFCAWAKGEGFGPDELPVKSAFTQQVTEYAPGVKLTRRSDGTRFFGIRIGHKQVVDD
jgi:P4 family phage/plasmid primase-like protien